MKLLLFTFTVFFSSPLYAIENLSREDYIGTWVSEWAVVDGEKQTLTISKDNSSVFERNFDTGSKQTFASNDIKHLDDLVIIKYSNEQGQMILKLIVSGWHAYGRYTLYGTMYMYNDGVIYNGLTVSLKRDEQ